MYYPADALVGVCAVPRGANASCSSVVGSPIPLVVVPAAPAVERFVASGVGLVKAVAGEQACLRVRVADRFNNTIQPTGPFPYAFGLLLVPSRGGEEHLGRMEGKNNRRHNAPVSVVRMEPTT
jgi:hypothetical protein